MNEEYLLIPFFKVGTFESQDGQKRSYTLQDLQEIERRYNERKEKAPIVIGHPAKNEEKPLGTIESVKIFKEKLFAFVDGVDSKFFKAFKSGAYRFCSVALQDLDIRHIGFLGAMPPAIKGLGDTFIIKEENDIKELGLKLSDGEIRAELSDIVELANDTEFAEMIEVDREKEDFAEIEEFSFDNEEMEDENEEEDITDYKQMYEELKSKYEKLLQEYNDILKQYKEAMAKKSDYLTKKLTDISSQGSSSTTTEREKNHNFEKLGGRK
ncbi:MAG: hypothetical protein J1G30_02025 [Spirochaetales bacterium]|nr:hypothetical protein [Spirochaetales bacterium]